MEFGSIRVDAVGLLLYLRAAAGLQVLDGGSEEERARLIAQRFRAWKSAANAF